MMALEKRASWEILMKGKKGGFFYSFFRGLNILRLIILNLIFFFILFLCIASLYKYKDSSKKTKNARVTVYADSVLLLNPAGRLIEKPDEFVWRNYLLSEHVPNTVLLSDITDALIHAAHDRRITAVLFDLTGLYGISSGYFSELKTALLEYKDSNKPLYVFSTGYRLGSYYIASFADHIYLDPMGEVDLSGFYSESLFYGDMEKKLGIRWNVIQAGDYKSMAETYSRTGLSDGVRSNHLSVFKDLWQQYLQDIAVNRSVDTDKFETYMLRYTDILRKVKVLRRHWSQIWLRQSEPMRNAVLSSVSWTKPIDFLRGTLSGMQITTRLLKRRKRTTK